MQWIRDVQCCADSAIDRKQNWNKQGQGKLIFSQPETMALTLSLSLFLFLTFWQPSKASAQNSVLCRSESGLFPKFKLGGFL